MSEPIYIPTFGANTVDALKAIRMVHVQTIVNKAISLTAIVSRIGQDAAWKDAANLSQKTADLKVQVETFEAHVRTLTEIEEYIQDHIKDQKRER